MLEAVFVCVNYNNYKDTVKYINHLEEKIDKELYDVIVIDNSDGDNEYFVIKNECEDKKNVYILNSSKNLGYFTAMQKGIEYYLNIRNELPNIIVVGNTDITIESGKFIDQINKNIEDNVLALAPNIILSDIFTKQNPFKENRISLKKLKFLRLVYSNSAVSYIYNLAYKIKNSSCIRREKRMESKNSLETIYAAHGSYIILLKEFFTRNGTLKYDGFLYGEEIFLAEQILKLNGKIKYCDDINIIHNENSVTGLLQSKQKRIYKLNSINYLIKYIGEN